VRSAASNGPTPPSIWSTTYMTNTTTESANSQIAVNDIGTAEDYLAAV
jgi:hypothetical protein